MGKRLRGLARTVKAVWVFTPLVITLIRDQKRFFIVGGKRDLNEEQMRKRARRATNAFERMGATYIKLVQFMTTRPDLVPPIYVSEFEKLQDDVEPEDYETIITVVEEELGPVDEVFDFFEEEAISGASIAQVHKAGLNGEDVAVKIRRPGVKEIIDADMWNLGNLIPVLGWAMRRFGHHSHAESLTEITREVERTLYEEIDFNHERDIMTETRQRFIDDGLDDKVVIPDTYPEYSTERVLTMSFEDGVKIKDVEGVKALGHDIEEIVEIIVDAYLRMAFVYKCYQADPHHGNLAVNEDGQAIIYDFGISERSKDHLIDSYVKFFGGLGMKEPGIALNALQEMGAIDPTMNRGTLLEVIELLINDISGGGVTDIDMERLEERVDQTLYDYPLTIHQEIVLAMRTTFGVEGLSAKVAPGYDFSEKLASFFIEADLFDIDFDEEAKITPVDTNSIEGVKQDIQTEIRRNGRRAVLSVAGGTAIIAGAVANVGGAGLLVYGGLGAVGGLLFLLVVLSFRSREEVAGPPIATRYHMDQWADDEEAPAEGEPEVLTHEAVAEDD